MLQKAAFSLLLSCKDVKNLKVISINNNIASFIDFLFNNGKFISL